MGFKIVLHNECNSVNGKTNSQETQRSSSAHKQQKWEVAGIYLVWTTSDVINEQQ